LTGILQSALIPFAIATYVILRIAIEVKRSGVSYVLEKIANVLPTVPNIERKTVFMERHPHAPDPAPKSDPYTPEFAFLDFIFSILILQMPILLTNPVSTEIITSNVKLNVRESAT